MLQELTQSKNYIKLATIVGVSSLIMGMVTKSILPIVIGIAVIGIQLIKMKSKRQEQGIDVVGEEAKSQWDKQR